MHEIKSYGVVWIKKNAEIEMKTVNSYKHSLQYLAGLRSAVEIELFAKHFKLRRI